MQLHDIERLVYASRPRIIAVPRILFAVCMITYIAGVCTAQAVSQGLPPLQLRGATAGYGIIEQGAVRALVHFDTEKKKIIAEWRYDSGESFDSLVSMTIQEFAVPYWPTALVVDGADRWVVSGKATRGSDTIIEMWDFTVGGDLQPHAFTEVQTGIVHYTWNLPQRFEVKEVYREATVGRDMALAMFHNPASSAVPTPPRLGSIYVLFYDSRDVYKVSLADGAFVRVASPLTSAGVLTVPALSESWDSFWCADHASRGYLFVCRRTTSSTCLVLSDPARTGSITQAQVVPPLDWINLNWSDEAEYLRYYY